MRILSPPHMHVILSARAPTRGRASRGHYYSSNMLSRMAMRAVAAIAAAASLCCSSSRCSVSAFAFTTPLRSASPHLQPAPRTTSSWDRGAQQQQPRQLRCVRSCSRSRCSLAQVASASVVWCMTGRSFQCGGASVFVHLRLRAGYNKSSETDVDHEEVHVFMYCPGHD